MDIAGCMYHVVARGIERRKIFLDEEDYQDFTVRLGSALKKTGCKCLAWCLMPNHFHLLLVRGNRPLSELMRRLMTGYAVYFNIKHKRAGHLFQNRYKALLCDEEEYLLELVAYIHLNPLRAKMVETLEDLNKYSWCGHGSLMGKSAVGFIERDYVLGHFGMKEKGAEIKYAVFMQEHVGKHKSGAYSSGGLIRSMGGLSNVLAAKRSGERERFDERVLGHGEFVEAVLKEAGDVLEEKMSQEEILKIIHDKTGINKDEITGGSQVRRVARARAMYCYFAKERGGTKGAALAKELKLTSSAISRLIERGRIFCKS